MSGRLDPPVSDAGAPFWEATRSRRLTLPWCLACEHPVWFPREVCPACLGSGLEWREASGRGAVYACTVEHQVSASGLRPPYVVALVDLDEGPRLLSNVVGCPPEDVAVGDRVRVTWEELPDGRQLPLFEPETA
ncbi:MAG: Zn-ribbon domain-containing OB-fold protein [Acidimicrobiales bacterium]